MDEHTAKRPRLSTEEVLLELENDEDDQDMPMSIGSDDDFDDITYEEKKRDEYGALDEGLQTQTILTVPTVSAPSELLALQSHSSHMSKVSELRELYTYI